MSRSTASALFLVLLAAGQASAGDDQGSSAPPLTYELTINGETFVVEADRQVKLESRENPGVTYEVALWIAMEQRVRLNTLRFEYDWPARVTDDRGRPHRTFRIEHELRYTLLITDLGGPLDPEARDRALEILRESTVEGFKRAGVAQDPVAVIAPHKFAHAMGHGFTIRYRDREGFAHTCVAYVLTGANFAAYCVVEYFDADAGAAIPRVKKTLDSIRPIR
jgi:hypothetical protein